MAINFPTSRFGFLEKEVNIERQTLKGGTALNGEQDLVSTDGGGRVFAEFSQGNLVDREKVLALRAMTTLLEEGVTRVIVPFCDTRHQPFGGEHRVTHDDGTPFSDGARYVGGGPAATMAGAAPLRATTVSMNVFLAQPLLGGEWFAIEHPNKGWRAYRIAQVHVQANGVATVSFRPPLREAVPDGAMVDFKDPRCLMVVDGQVNNRLSNGRYSEAAIRFVEAP